MSETVEVAVKMVEVNAESVVVRCFDAADCRTGC